MKLRNKKTGEIGELSYFADKVYVLVNNELKTNLKYTSLAELNEDWEDYEEPKTFFTLYYDGTISEFKDGDDEQTKDMKAIGNYFETREEAEKAVEKLKAWKRLKDADFRFNEWYEPDGCEPFIVIETNICKEDVYNLELCKDLDLLFGGD